MRQHLNIATKSPERLSIRGVTDYRSVGPVQKGGITHSSHVVNTGKYRAESSRLSLNSKGNDYSDNCNSFRYGNFIVCIYMF